MGTAELRRYFVETYDYETGLPDYEVEETISISENAIDYLEAPDKDEISYYEWVYVGTRAERLYSLGIDVNAL